MAYKFDDELTSYIRSKASKNANAIRNQSTEDELNEIVDGIIADGNRGYADRFISNFKAGAAGVGSGIAQFVGADGTADTLNKVVENNSNSRQYQSMFDDGFVTDPQGLTSTVANQLGSMAALLPFGIAAEAALPTAAIGSGVAGVLTSSLARLGAKNIAEKLGSKLASEGAKTFASRATQGALSGVAESMSEGGNVENQLLDEGSSKTDAAQKGREVFAKNLPFLMASNALEYLALSGKLSNPGAQAGESMATRALKAPIRMAPDTLANAIQNGYEEVFQQTFSDDALGHPTGSPWDHTSWTPGQKQAFNMGFAGSGVIGSGTGMYHGMKVQKKDGKQPTNVPAEVTEASQAAGQEAVRQVADEISTEQQQPSAQPQNSAGFENFFNSIAQQESGGDYNARGKVVDETGDYAIGKYQIMKSNWPSWAQEAGLPADAEPTPENQEIVARNKMQQYYNKYGARGAALAWYGGEGAINYSDDALNQRQVSEDGTVFPSLNDYAQQVLSRMDGQSGEGIDLNFNQTAQASSPARQENPAQEKEETYEDVYNRVLQYADTLPVSNDEELAVANPIYETLDSGDKNAIINLAEKLGLKRGNVQANTNTQAEQQTQPQASLEGISPIQTATNTNEGVAVPGGELNTSTAPAVDKQASHFEKQQAAIASRPAGKTVTSTTDASNMAKFPTQYRLVEVSDLTTSNNPDDFSTNELYPAELQPKSRDTAPLAGQVMNIAGKGTMEPMLLVNRDLNINSGAPLINEFGIVENGNGRTMGITRAYKAGDAGQKYKEHLANTAEDFGFTREQVAGMQQPVLVRQRMSDDVDLQKIISANAGGASMSASDQAKVDAKSISAKTLSLYQPNISNGITAKNNLEFMAAALADITHGNAGEVNKLVTGQNMTPSDDGYKRVKDATFALAYQDDNLLAKMSEERNDANIISVLDAMEKAAPYFARIQSLMADGTLHEYNIAKPIVDAATKLMALRKEGKPVATFLSEQQLLGDELSDEARNMLRAFDEGKYAKQRIFELLLEIGKAVEAIGPTNQESIFGDVPLPTLGEVFGAALKLPLKEMKGDEKGLFTEKQEDKNAGHNSQDAEPGQTAKQEAVGGNGQDAAVGGSEATQSDGKNQGVNDALLAKIKRFVELNPNVTEANAIETFGKSAEQGGEDATGKILDRLIATLEHNQEPVEAEPVINSKVQERIDQKIAKLAAMDEDTTEADIRRDFENMVKEDGMQAAELELDTAIKELEEYQETKAKKPQKQAKKEPAKKADKKPAKQDKTFSDRKDNVKNLASVLGIKTNEQLNAEKQAKETVKIVNVVDDSAEHEAELIERLKKRNKGRLSANPMFDPENMQDGLELGLMYAQRGINKFADWSKHMIEQLGDLIKPWLGAIWKAMRACPEGTKFEADKISAVMNYVGDRYDNGQRDFDSIMQDWTEDFGEDASRQFKPLLEIAYAGINEYYNPTVIEDRAETNNPLPEIGDNKTKPLNYYADTMYTGIRSFDVLSFLKPNWVEKQDRQLLLTNAKELAMDADFQDNKTGHLLPSRVPVGYEGILLEFKTKNLDGQVDLRKPNATELYNQGQAEFIAEARPADFTNALISITVDDNRHYSQFDRNSLSNILEEQGWQEIVRDNNIKTYVKPGVDVTKYLQEGGKINVHHGGTEDTERNSAGNNQDGVGADNGRTVTDGSGGDSDGKAESGRSANDGESGLHSRSAATGGEVGNSGVQGEASGSSKDSSGSADLSTDSRANFEGLSTIDDGRSEADVTATQDGRNDETAGLNKALVKEWDKYEPNHLAGIQKDLPVLTKGQVLDVAFAEKRLYENHGRGVLFTNGTGTGKTFTGLGIIKRLHNAGKRNILIVTPSQDINGQWVTAARNHFGININTLKDTQDAGEGTVITTYANFQGNNQLAHREWDAIIADEAHNLMSSEDGKMTASLQNLRALTYHNKGFGERAHRLLETKEMRELSNDVQKLKTEINKLEQAVNKRDFPRSQREETLRLIKNKEGLKNTLQQELDRKWQALEPEIQRLTDEWKQIQPGDKPKVVFLSATPFNYTFDIDYAEGYLIDFVEPENRGGYNQPSARDKFYIDNFKYRMVTGKLTKPEGTVDSRVTEVDFHEKLKREGILSDHILDVDVDYDRGFIVVQDPDAKDGKGIGQKIDEGFEWLREAQGGRYRQLYDALTGQYTAKQRNYLLESIKARGSIEIIKQYVASGKKVAVYHQRKKQQDLEHPFILDTTKLTRDEHYDDVLWQYRQFKENRPDLLALNFRDLKTPIETYIDAFGEDAMIYNGDTSPKNKAAYIRAFNSDDNGKNIIIVQSDAGNAGISLHDTTGKHQRVLLNISIPSRPSYAMQTEGRIFRFGSVTNAIFRYLSTGTNIEKMLFAETLAGKVSTAENLGMGAQARNLRDSFVNLYQETLDGSWVDRLPGKEGEGTGGKENDNAMDLAFTEFERAKTYYYGNQKKNSKNKSQEGRDYYATPEPLGYKMVEWLGAKLDEALLEPSAGHGAISRFFTGDTYNTIVEPSGHLAPIAQLNTPNARAIMGDFEDLDIVNKYNGIVMNPPYGVGGKTAMEHMLKAFKHLRNGGRLIAIVPNGPSMDKRLENFRESKEAKNFYSVAEILLPSSTFGRAGTSVNTKILVFDKYEDGKLAEKMKPQLNIDLSNANNNEELFNRIENLSLPERINVKTEADASVERAPEGRPGKQASNNGIVGAKSGTFIHTKTHAEIPSASLITHGFDPEHFAKAKEIAKRNGGYWDRNYAKAFLFKTADGRDNFINSFNNELQIDREEAYDQANDTQYSIDNNLANAVLSEKDWSEAIKNAFKGLSVEQIDGTHYAVRLPSGNPVYIETGAKISFTSVDKERAEQALGRKLLPNERPVGFTKTIDGARVIGLADGATTQTVDHEAFHVAMAMALGKTEYNAMLKNYSDKNGSFNEEQAADDYAAFADKAKQATTMFGKLFAKIQHFLSALKLKLGIGNASDVFRIVNSGKVWNSAKLDANTATSYKTEQVNRPYANVPDRLMGIPGDGRQSKGFAQEKYKYVLNLRITIHDKAKPWDDIVWEDAVKGLNRSHAYERALRNWPQATKIEALDGERISVETTDLKFSVQQAEETLAENVGAKEKGTIEVIDKKKAPNVDLVDAVTTSPWRIAQRVPGFRMIHKWAVSAMNLQEKLRSSYGRKLAAALKIVHSKQLKEDLYSLLWRGDMEGAEWTREELVAEGFDDNVIESYTQVRRLIKTAYNRMNEARQHVQTYSKNMSASKLAALQANKFVTILGEPQETGNDNYLVTWKEPQNWEKHYSEIDEETYARFLKDEDIQILTVKEYTNIDGETVYEVDTRERIGNINKLTGYIPHFFHDFFIMEKKTDEEGNDTYQVLGPTGSAKTLKEAYKIAQEYQKKNPEMNIVIKPKEFHLDKEAEQAIVIGDMDYEKMVQRLAKDNEMSIPEIKEMLDGKVRLKGRHRFFGNLLQRKGVDGYEKDMEWVLRHYFNGVSRYVALESEFKPKAISMFERVYGAWDQEHRGTAKYVKDFINDVNGNPSSLEQHINDKLNNNKYWRKYVSSHFGDRAALQLAGSVTNTVSILKLGLFNISSAMLNMTQLINAAGVIGSVSSVLDGIQRLSHLSMRDKGVLIATGVLDDIGFDSGSGYTKLTAGKLASSTMFLFKKSEQMCRRGTVLAAYHKAIAEGKTHKQAIEYAKLVNRRANFDYSVADAPNVFRRGSIISQIVLQFKKYPIKQFELFKDMLSDRTDYKQKAIFWGGYFLLSGLLQIPAIDWFDDFAQQFTGKSEKLTIKKAMMEFAGAHPEMKPLVNWAMYGLGSTVGLDFSNRTGQANVIPQKLDKYTLGGPAYSTVMGFLVNMWQNEPLAAAKSLSPGLANVMQVAAGHSTTKRGRVDTVYDTAQEKIIKLLGFNTMEASTESDFKKIVNQANNQKSKARQQAMDTYIAEPTQDNWKAMKALGVTPEQMRAERKKKMMPTVERTHKSMSKESRREYKDLNQYLKN